MIICCLTVNTYSTCRINKISPSRLSILSILSIMVSYQQGTFFRPGCPWRLRQLPSRMLGGRLVQGLGVFLSPRV